MINLIFACLWPWMRPWSRLDWLVMSTGWMLILNHCLLSFILFKGYVVFLSSSFQKVKAYLIGLNWSVYSNDYLFRCLRPGFSFDSNVKELVVSGLHVNARFLNLHLNWLVFNIDLHHLYRVISVTNSPLDRMVMLADSHLHRIVVLTHPVLDWVILEANHILYWVVLLAHFVLDWVVPITDTHLNWVVLHLNL